jgi:hypothetical protein
MSDESGALYKVAYDEAVRALAHQQAAIDNLRSRAGLMLSAGAVTTSFLGAQALQARSLNAPSWLALATFVAMAGALLGVLWPFRWEFSADAREVIDTYVESVEPEQIAGLHRELALHLRDGFARNLDGLSQLAVLLQIASGLLVIEVTLWITAIGWPF